MSSINNESFEGLLRKRIEDVNFAFPSSNKFGMMWFRDDDVEIGDSFNSVLTVYQPLFDARDQDLIRLSVDETDPSILYHVHPTVPTFMYSNFEKVYEQESSVKNPEIFSETRKKHKKHASKIKRNKNARLEMSEYHLPFSLSMNKFDDIANSYSEIKKHYRTIEVDVHVDAENDIKHTCSYIYWKILIDGETTNLADDDDANIYADAHTRMSNAFGSMAV